MITDQDLAGRIRQAILDDERVSVQTMEVLAQNGVVTLRGTVPSHRRKLVAQQIAASFEGCRGVVNDLAVEPAGAIGDEEIAANVRAALDAHADITKEVMTVAVRSGKVTLHGHAASNWERTLAEDVALAVRGVRSVQNLVVTDLVQEMEDEGLSRAIADALQHARGLKGEEVSVAVSGGLAVLSGRVKFLWQKETADDVVRRFRILSIRNEIAVVG